MNTKTLFILSLLIASNTMARTDAYRKELNDALFRRGAKASVIFCVKDPENNVVDKAYVRAGFWMADGKGNRVLDYTDKEGRLKAEKYANRDVNYWIEKSNYYITQGRYELSHPDEISVKDGKWIPYGKEIDVVLKPIKNPIPMYIGGSRLDLAFPKQNTPIGFDMIKQDWISPHGKGEIADFTLTYKEELKPGGNGYAFRCSLAMAFNHELDGAYRMKSDNYSDLKSVYHANVDALYLKEFLFSLDHWNAPWNDFILEDEYLVLRTRTKVDSNGKLIEAHYSKIYGPIKFLNDLRFDGTSFNPTPNDTNLEGDIKKNLLPEQSSSIQP